MRLGKVLNSKLRVWESESVIRKSLRQKMEESTRRTPALRARATSSRLASYFTEGLSDTGERAP